MRENRSRESSFVRVGAGVAPATNGGGGLTTGRGIKAPFKACVVRIGTT